MNRLAPSILTVLLGLAFVFPVIPSWAVGGLTVISPNGGEEWVPGKAYKIQWQKGTSLPHVAITILPGRKTTREYIVAKTENDGSYSWKIPSSFKTGTIYEISVESFSYHPACTTYSYLNKGYGYSYLITKNKGVYKGWPGNYCCTKSGAGSKGDGYAEAQKTLESCNERNSGNCEIIDVNGDNCKSTATAYDSSNKRFTISKPDSSSIKVTTPNGGQKWKTGKSYNLKWTHKKAGAKVKIQLLKSGKHYKWVSKSTKNDGKHVWKIPSTVATGSVYKIKITSTSKKTVTDTSNKNFKITKTKGVSSSLRVTTPNGGQKWETGKSYTLKWTHKTAGAKVKIQLLKSGKHYKWVSKSTKNDGKHVWKIPTTVATGSAYKIKITSTSKKTVTDTSNKNFKITKVSGGDDDDGGGNK